MPVKYPVHDKDFYIKMRGACLDQEERGLVEILELSGMHVSSICKLKKDDLIRQGSKFILQWIRPKTNLKMQAIVPKEYLEDIKYFLEKRRKKRITYYYMIKKIGERAGYDNISPMTFRHQRCIRALRDENFSVFEVPHLMGCSLNVVVRNYSKIKESELLERSEKND